jgi:C1A family cysteine protease
MTAAQFKKRQFYTPQPADKKDFKHKAGLFGFIKGLLNAYPNEYVQGNIGTIEDQGQTNSCVGHMVSSMLETLTSPVGGVEFSRLAIYYRARWYSKTTDQDSGCYIRDALKGVKRFGVLRESEWPFDASKVLDNPSLVGLAMPVVFTALRGVAQIKQALCAGKPVGLAFNVPDNIFFAPRGVVAFDATRLSGNYHAVRIFGYDSRGLLFKNSWGKSWGRNGCGVLAWDYVTQGAVVDVTSVELAG